jgi:hypothetical protein
MLKDALTQKFQLAKLSHFDSINLKASLVTRKINFNGIKNMAHLCDPFECDYLSNFQFTTHLSHLC